MYALPQRRVGGIRHPNQDEIRKFKRCKNLVMSFGFKNDYNCCLPNTDPSLSPVHPLMESTIGSLWWYE